MSTFFGVKKDNIHVVTVVHIFYFILIVLLILFIFKENKAVGLNAVACGIKRKSGVSAVNKCILFNKQVC